MNLLSQQNGPMPMPLLSKLEQILILSFSYKSPVIFIFNFQWSKLSASKKGPLIEILQA
jgi:hypothetical protein